ncbi:MAG TPA: methyltransferase domain-containing protein [Pseudonocardiaceae bacterium]|nr:methyltransferase domain-containing protein [Pseudonocardiaceae bacterium]
MTTSRDMATMPTSTTTAARMMGTTPTSATAPDSSTTTTAKPPISHAQIARPTTPTAANPTRAGTRARTGVSGLFTHSASHGPDAWQRAPVAVAYSECFDTTAARVFGYPFVLEEVAQSIPLRAVVDFGCGPGTAAALAAHRWNCQVRAVDPSVTMLDIARKHNPDPRISYHHMRPGDLGFIPSGTVDGVMCCLVMATIDDVAMLKQVIGEAYRVLRPGGVFAMLEGHPDGVGVEFTMKRPAPGSLPRRPGDTWQVLLKATRGDDLLMTDIYWDARTYVSLFEKAKFREPKCSAPLLRDAERLASPDDVTRAFWATERVCPPYLIVSGRK